MTAMTLDAVLSKCESTGLFLDGDPLDVNRPNLFGDRPLHLACGWGDLESVQVLPSAGAAVNAIGDREQTPLFRAATEEVASALLNAGADVTARDMFGQTASAFLTNVGKSQIAALIEREPSR